MKRCVKFLLLLALLAAGVGGLAIGLGMAPIAASAGHWPITSWALHSVMRHTVHVRAWRIEAPALQDEARVLRGAGHFARGCAACHGAPGERRPVTVLHMTPHPPALPPRINEWKPRELFWIVKHGVKFTGMPAWPAQQRDDEVWDVVAFLLQLPELSPQRYRALAFGEMTDHSSGLEAKQGAALAQLAQPLRDIVKDCARCHGVDGAGRGADAFPRLLYQSERYLYESLRAYADGARFSGIMQPIASSLDDEALRAVARHYARAEAAPAQRTAYLDDGARERGERIAKQGLPGQGVASCADCHGPTSWQRNPAYPRLAGQTAAYLIAQLKLFKDGRRGGTGHAHIMDTSVNRLTEQQMQDVASYYQHLRPQTSPP